MRCACWAILIPRTAPAGLPYVAVEKGKRAKWLVAA